MNPIKLYRLSNALYLLDVPILPKVITLLIRLIFCCYLPHSAVIKRDLVLAYGGLGIVIHGRVEIGNRCHISQNVTIGGTSKKISVPVLGDDVYIGAGAKILGPVKVGNNVVIGANSVVVENIPSNSLVVGVPGKIIKTGIQKADYV